MVGIVLENAQTQTSYRVNAGLMGCRRRLFETVDAWMEWTCSTASCTQAAIVRRCVEFRTRLQAKVCPSESACINAARICVCAPVLHSACRMPHPTPPILVPPTSPILVTPHPDASHTIHRFPSPFRVLRRLSPYRTVTIQSSTHLVALSLSVISCTAGLNLISSLALSSLIFLVLCYPFSCALFLSATQARSERTYTYT